MMKHRRHYRKPDLLLLAAAVIAGILMTSSATAGDLIEYRAVDTGTRLMSLFVGQGYMPDPANPASRVTVSFTPSPDSTAWSSPGSVSDRPSQLLFTWSLDW